MNEANPAPREERVLVLAPTPQDVALTRALLADAAIVCTPCSSLPQLCDEFGAGAGVLLLTEEALADASSTRFVEVLQRQPMWSDVPVLVLTARGADSALAHKAMAALPNVTLLERPVRLLTLVSAVRSSLKARRRQYALRDQLEALSNAERRERFLAELGDELRALADTVAIQEHAARLLGRHLGASRVHYVEVSADGRHGLVNVDYQDGVPSVVGLHRFDDYGAEVMDEMRAGGIVVVADVQADPRLSAAAKAATARLGGTAAYVVMPLYKGGRTEALLVVHYAEPHQWSVAEVDLIGQVGERTWAAVERARAERSLRDNEQRLRMASEAASMFSWSCDLPSGAIQWSDNAAAVIGCDPARLPGNIDSGRFFLAPEEAERVRQEFEQAVAQQRTMFAGEFRGRGEPQTARHFLAQARLVYGADGTPLQAFGVTQDITERKRAELALKEADRRKDEFLATLAHELRNPLAPIRIAAQILKADDAPGATLAWSRDIIERQVAHMARLLDDLLDVSRITRNRLELRKARITLANVVAGAVEVSRPLIEAAHHELTVALPDAPVLLEADPVRLEQVLANLLNNSAKYTPDGGRIELRAHVEPAGDRREVVISVQDNGIGIDPETLPRVFEMFSQSKSALARSQGGLGIGLALSWGLVQMHGGRITAHSAGMGQGSRFEVRLPLLEPRPSAFTAQPAAQPALEPPRQRLRVLVADDSRDSADSLSMLLKMTGYEVHTAYDGAEAVEMAERTRPDVALLDLGMPRMSGHEACQRLRQQAWSSQIIIVALTGWGQAEDRRRSQDVGFDFHLVKPVDPGDLSRLLSSVTMPGRAD